LNEKLNFWDNKAHCVGFLTCPYNKNNNSASCVVWNNELKELEQFTFIDCNENNGSINCDSLIEFDCKAGISFYSLKKMAPIKMYSCTDNKNGDYRLEYGDCHYDHRLEIGKCCEKQSSDMKICRHFIVNKNDDKNKDLINLWNHLDPKFNLVKTKV